MQAALQRVTGVSAGRLRVIAGVAGALAGGLLLDVAIAYGYAVPVALLIGGGTALAIGLANWRWSLLGLIAYLPFAGIPAILMFPNTGPAVLLKDLLFVGPAYAGVLVGMTALRRPITFPGAPLALLLIFGTWVSIQALNPALPSHLVGLIGMKVWLWYVPLYFLGYHLLRTRDELRRVLGLMVAVALVPLVIGIAEAIAIDAGHAEDVYRPYGAAAAAATQSFAETRFSDNSRLFRIPSTFTFMTQYYLFTTVMIAVAYGWWRLEARAAVRAVLGPSAFMLAVAASLLTGSRAAFLFVPIVVVAIVALDRPFSSLSRAVPIAALVAMGVAALALLGAHVTAIAELVLPASKQYFDGVFVQGVATGFERTWLGLGTGIDTGAARYALPGGQISGVALAAGIGGQESWYAKAVLELGLPGLVLLVAILGVLGVRTVRHHRALRDPGLRAVSAGILVLFLWTVVNGLKSQFVDLDPLNVYFWLLLGIHERLPSFDAPPAAAAPRARSGR